MKVRQSSNPNRSPASLPSESDFDPYGGCLDAQSAWKHFGGLDLDSAYRKFCENPVFYQEDLMFMGPTAFRFYFPVVDRYLREIRNDDEFGDCEAWILGKAIAAQLETDANDELLMSIDRLCSYVRAHLAQYASSLRDQKRVDKAWVSVENRVSKQRRKHP